MGRSRHEFGWGGTRGATTFLVSRLQMKDARAQREEEFSREKQLLSAERRSTYMPIS